MSKSLHNYSSLGFFNEARGLGIIWIIAGHSMALFLTGKPGVAADALFAGAGRVLGGGVIAMFFMISGFYFYRRSPAKCFRTQAKLLLKPYAVTGLVILLMEIWLILLKGTRLREETLGLVLTYLLGLNGANKLTLFGIPLKSISVFWFLLALFIGWVLYNFILWLKSPRLQRICVIGCIMVSWCMSELTAVWPYVLPNGLLAVGYLAAGHMIREQKLLERKLTWPMWLGIGGVTLVSMAFGNVDVASGIWKLGLVDMAGSFCVGFLLLRLHNGLARRNWNGFFMRAMEWIGRNSIWLICLHALEKEVIQWSDLKQMFPGRPALCTVLCFTVRSAVMYLLWIAATHLRKGVRRTDTRRIIITEE